MASAQGFNWREEAQKTYREQNYTGTYDITSVEDEITERLLACRDCAKNFKITSQELVFYRKIGVAIWIVVTNGDWLAEAVMGCGRGNVTSVARTFKLLTSAPIRKVLFKECYLGVLY